MAGKDLQTEAIVLKRVNYGEADRILTLITPTGKISAIAKGVRKAKSRLAGGVEMFTLALLNLHEGKSDLCTVTGAKMVKYYGEILKDFGRMELAGEILKEVGRKAEGEGAEFFEICRQGLEALNGGHDVEIVRAWMVMTMANLTEGVNLYRDASGEKLTAEARYDWDEFDKAFTMRSGGNYGASGGGYGASGGGYGADEIKMLRLLATAPLATVLKVKASEETMGKVLEFVRRMS